MNIDLTPRIDACRLTGRRDDGKRKAATFIYFRRRISIDRQLIQRDLLQNLNRDVLDQKREREGTDRSLQMSSFVGGQRVGLDENRDAIDFVFQRSETLNVQRFESKVEKLYKCSSFRLSLTRERAKKPNREDNEHAGRRGSVVEIRTHPGKNVPFARRDSRPECSANADRRSNWRSFACERFAIEDENRIHRCSTCKRRSATTTMTKIHVGFSAETNFRSALFEPNRIRLENEMRQC